MNSCKILAIYLPQFHRIPENDEWWGEGFTEWNVVKNAKQLTKKAIQPRIPQCGYYDLSDVESIKMQAKLAKKYHVDGFAMYSYYSNGKTLLEKPAQLLLENKDIEINYCFSWANHDWKRTWFSYDFEMLWKQEYARNDEEIKEHFEYLLPYFLDNRYIKYNNKPVYIVYDYKKIENFERYKELWNQYSKEYGFDGVYFVQTLCGKTLTWNEKLFDACFDFEPTYTTYSGMKIENGINFIRRALKKVLKFKYVKSIFNYKEVCRQMERRICENPNHMLGAFAEWDNTPRHGSNGTVFKGFNIDTFRTCFYKQLKKSKEHKKPFLIIDAWNEWGEGAFLEPDQVYGYEKLEVIKECVEKLNDEKELKI